MSTISIIILIIAAILFSIFLAVIFAIMKVGTIGSRQEEKDGFSPTLKEKVEKDADVPKRP